MTRIKSIPVLDRILTWSLDHPLTPLARYLAATLAIVVVAVLRATLITSLLPWLLFIPTIIAIALFLGERPGVYASVLAAMSAAITIGSLDEPWLALVQFAGRWRSQRLRTPTGSATVASRSKLGLWPPSQGTPSSTSRDALAGTGHRAHASLGKVAITLLRPPQQQRMRRAAMPSRVIIYNCIDSYLTRF